ncbi:MAG: hypothetical protein FWC32_03500 [Firmicutes bacterium]|nr:hypothetical protein [Bacillota bacterium]
MNVNATTNGGAVMASVPLAENEYVKELLGILKDNGKDTGGLTALLNHVKGMEDFCKQAENKISDMKTQLTEMKEIQDHPIKHALQNTIKSLEAKVAEIKAHLTELKDNIIDGCKNAVAAFKDKGIAALDKIASFFRVKTCLEKIKDCAVADVKECDKTIASINTFSKEYHKAGRSLANMARVIVGMKPIDTIKENGKLAKAVSAPCRAQRACAIGIRNAATSAIEKLNQLSQDVSDRRDAKQSEKASTPKKPSLMQRLDDKKALVRQKDLERPVPERGTRVQEAGL